MPYNQSVVKPLLTLSLLAVGISVYCGESLDLAPGKSSIPKVGGGMVCNFYHPLKAVDEWQHLLAAKTQWRDGYSAKSLAVTWFGRFPRIVEKI